MAKNSENDIEIPETKYHRIISFLSLILLLGIFVYLLITWKHIPAKVPGHYNGAGEIDRWGGKYELFVCPIISIFLYLLITLLKRHPELWNTGVDITEKNKVRIYSILKNMIVTLKFATVFTLSSLTVYSAQACPLPGWFTPFYLFLFFGPMAYFLILLYKKRSS